ncbi:hypothetical protein GPALN_010621 [Globodera pallida]|nr:hypothetical protein GPALN_010621 [Globodera pallida]
MYAIVLLLLAVLLRATNALECWQGMTEITTPGGTINLMAFKKCPAHLAFTHCTKISCSMDEEALKEIPDIPPGTKSKTGTAKGCLLPMGECELPDEGIGLNGVPFKTMKKYCKMSCCEGNGCNGTLGLGSLGTVAAIMALFAAFFVRWN